MSTIATTKVLGLPSSAARNSSMISRFLVSIQIAMRLKLALINLRDFVRAGA